MEGKAKEEDRARVEGRAREEEEDRARVDNRAKGRVFSQQEPNRRLLTFEQ